MRHDSQTSTTRSSKLVVGFIAISVLIASTTMAAANPKSTKSKAPSTSGASAAPSPSSSWVLPSQKNKNPVVVQAGRSLPLKFEIVQSGTKLLSTDMVQITTTKLENCNSSTKIGAPIVIVSAKPTASPSASSTVSPTPKESAELKNDNGTFSYVWKVPKDFKSGCYQLTATKGDATLSSPVINVKGTK